MPARPLPSPPRALRPRLRRAEARDRRRAAPRPGRAPGPPRAPDGDAAGRAVARVAAMQGAAPGADGDAGLAQLGQRAPVVERVLERAQLGVDGGQRGELAAHELLVEVRELVLVEDEAAEVA